jgi:O-antigen/teichoic acid export membrane protein
VNKTAYVLASIIERLGSVFLAWFLSTRFGMLEYGNYVYYTIFFEIIFVAVHFSGHERIIVRLGGKMKTNMSKELSSIFIQSIALFMFCVMLLFILNYTNIIDISILVIVGLLILVISRVFTMIVGALFRVWDRVWDYVSMVISGSVFSAILGVSSVAYYESIEFLFFFQGLGYLIIFVFFFIRSGLYTKLSFVDADYRDYHFSLPLLISRYGMMITTAGNKFLIATLVSKSVLGSFNIYLMLASILEIVSDGLGKADMLRVLDWKSRRFGFSSEMIRNFWVLFVISAVLLILGPILFRVIASDNVMNDGLFTLVILGLLVKSSNKFSVLKLYMKEKSKELSWIYVFTGIFSVIFSYFLVRIYGEIGLGISMVSVYSIQMFLTWYVTKRGV